MNTVKSDQAGVSRERYVRRLAEDHEISLNDLAESAGMARATMTSQLRSNRIRASAVDAIARALGISAADIWAAGESQVAA